MREDPYSSRTGPGENDGIRERIEFTKPAG